MIWLRRSFAVVLAILFLPIFLAVLLVNQVNGTVGNPRFYVNQLRDADVYNFLYDDLLPTALDEWKGDLGKEGPKLDMPKLKGRALDTARQTLPPEWLQAQTEQAITQVMPYFLGDTDSFTLTIPVKERVKAASQAVKTNFLTKETFPTVYDPMVAWAVDRGLANLDKVPFRLSLTRDELDSSIRTVLPQDWLLAQANGTLDGVVPYLTKDQPRFTVTVPLADRVEAAKAVAVRILSKPETYNFIMDEVVVKAIQENVGQNIQLPFGIAVTQGEVLAAVKEVVPQPWLRDRLTDLLDRSAAYISGRSPTISLELPLADRKAAAIQVIAGLADRKLRTLYDSLPQCTPQDLARGILVGGVPVCKPAGLSFEDGKKLLDIDVARSVNQYIGGAIPDKWTINEPGLREALGKEAWDTVLEARKQVMNGFTFTDADLKKRLGPDRVSTLEDVRGWIADGFTFTEKDLRERLRESAEPGAPDPVEQIDNIRHQLGSARRLIFLLWVVPLLFLVGIGFLGGRNWYSRLAWAAAVLVVGAAIAFLAAALVYPAVARPALESGLAEAVRSTEGATARLVAEKGTSMALAAADAFVSGLRTKALLALVLGAAGLAAARVLARRRAGPSPEQPPPQPPPASLPKS